MALKKHSKGLPARPSEQEIARLKRLFRPLGWLSSPRVWGLDALSPTGPSLFVGNHTLLGLMDIPALFLTLHDQKGIYLRSLGDHLHWRLPLWRALLERLGAVEGTRENCSALFRAQEHVLVFPGGAREVTKRKDEKYRLIWKERLGFAKLAIRHQCQVIPFSSVGVEESLDIVADANDLLKSPLGGMLKALGLREDTIPPLV